MIRKFFIALCLALVVALVAYLWWRDDPRAILDRAIEAHGGEAKILQARTGRIKGRDKGQGFTMDWEETFSLPGRCKRSSSSTVEGRVIERTYLVKDGRYFLRREDGELENRPANTTDELNNFFGLVAILIRIRDNSTRLSSLGRTTIQEQPAVGIRAVLFDESEVDLYFSKRDWLLIKVSMKWLTSRGVRVPRYFYYSEHKEVDGVQIPHRWGAGVVEDAIDITGELIEVKMLQNVPADVFATP